MLLSLYRPSSRLTSVRGLELRLILRVFKDALLLREPIAAALSYNKAKLSDQTKKEELIMVFDLGGGTFAVTICHLSHTSI